VNRSEALTRIRALCPPELDPELTIEQQDECLRAAGVADDEGVVPTDEDWTPTYSPVGVLRGALVGWRMKRANASNRFEFSTDGQMFRPQQVLDNIDGQISDLRRQLARSVPTE